jgi:hypothetical protein
LVCSPNSDFNDEKFRVRRGYLVTFKVEKDEEDKTYASEIKLTVEGQASAVAINEAITKKREEALDDWDQRAIKAAKAGAHGFRKMLRLITESDDDLTRLILQTLRHFVDAQALLLEKEEVEENECKKTKAKKRNQIQANLRTFVARVPGGP